MNSKFTQCTEQIKKLTNDFSGYKKCIYVLYLTAPSSHNCANIGSNLQIKNINLPSLREGQTENGKCTILSIHAVMLMIDSVVVP